jgi:hypothetical protein
VVIQASAPPVVLEDAKEFYEIGLNLDILEDSTGKLTIDDVNRPEWALKFKKSHKKIPYFGFSKSAFWARFKIINNSGVGKDLLVSQHYFLQDEVSFFKKKKGGWEESKTGDIYPFRSREIKSRPITFKIRLEKEAFYFIRIKGAPSRLTLTLRLGKTNTLISLNSTTHLSNIFHKT